MNFSRKKILYVEDDCDDYFLFMSFLKEKKWPIEVVHAKNGLHAMELLDKAPGLPDIIITDMNMPKYSGEQFIKNIKESQQYRQIPIIILTTLATPGILNFASELKILHFKKPSTLDDINRIVLSILEILL